MYSYSTVLCIPILPITRVNNTLMYVLLPLIQHAYAHQNFTVTFYFYFYNIYIT